MFDRIGWEAIVESIVEEEEVRWACPVAAEDIWRIDALLTLSYSALALPIEDPLLLPPLVVLIVAVVVPTMPVLLVAVVLVLAAADVEMLEADNEIDANGMAAGERNCWVVAWLVIKLRRLRNFCAAAPLLFVCLFCFVLFCLFVLFCFVCFVLFVLFVYVNFKYNTHNKALW